MQTCRYGVELVIEYPLVGASPAQLPVGATQRVLAQGGVSGDMIRWVPACELGCGRVPYDNDFPFVALAADPTTSSPPPPAAPNPPTAPDVPAMPLRPPSPYAGLVGMGVVSLPAATYKACYAYQEDFVEAFDAAGETKGVWPQLSFTVEVPLVAGSTALVISRPGDPPPTVLSHDTPVEVRMNRYDWRWVKLSTMCDEDAPETPIPGCAPGVQLQAALEVDAAFSRLALRYHSAHHLLVHATVHQPPVLTSIAADGVPSTDVVVDARSCFDGLDEPRLSRLAAGYLQPADDGSGAGAGAGGGGAGGGGGGGLVEPDVHGVRQHLDRDRATYHIGTNTSSGGCNTVPTTEVWLRLRCIADGLPGGACLTTVRGVLLPISIPPGLDARFALPLEPGVSDGAARIVLSVALGDADILKLTLVGRPVGCGGADGARAYPHNDTAAFLGTMIASRTQCPDASAAAFAADAPAGQQAVALPAGGAGNASIDFFCTDQPGVYHFLVDAASQPTHTEGPPALADDGGITGCASGAPLSSEVCLEEWDVLFDGLRSNASLLTDGPTNRLPESPALLPRAWKEGEARNVLRRGRLSVELRVARSEPFATNAFADGEVREACLAYGQLRTFRIFTGGSHNSTLFVRANMPISAAYARRHAPPDVPNGLYDTVIQLSETPRWGCADKACEGRRLRFALSVPSCEPSESGFWCAVPVPCFFFRACRICLSRACP